MKILYFGCDRRAGHFLHHPGMRHAAWNWGDEKPWPDIPWTRIDGALCPNVIQKSWGLENTGPQTLGLGLIHHKDGWTAWAFWDRTVDSRLGSNSIFFAEGEHDLDGMKALAQEHFPQVWKRVAHLDFQLA